VIWAGPSGECLSRCSAVRVPGNGPCAAGAVGRPDLYRRAAGNPREPGSSDRADALEAALRDCPGLPPVS
jgi:hypothetical protein